ncbi:MAG: hypothetical protein ACLQVD_21660 [Capsulimonadaceae bacterium]
MNNFLHVNADLRRGLKSLGGCVALLSLVCCAANVACAQEPAPAGTIRSILLFPINNNSGAGAREVTSMLDDAIHLRLSAVNRFAITRFRKTMPSVEQGLDDREITEDDVAGPFGDSGSGLGGECDLAPGQQRALHIAQRLDVDAYFIGDINRYSADPASRRVTVEVTGSLYYTPLGSNCPVVAKAIGVSVTEKPLTESEDPDDVRQSAIDNVAGQIASSINSVPEPGSWRTGSGFQARHINAVAAMLYTVVGGAVLYAVLHKDGTGGGGSSPSSSTTGGTTLTPPPPPASPVGRR